MISSKSLSFLVFNFLCFSGYSQSQHQWLFFAEGGPLISQNSDYEDNWGFSLGFWQDMKPQKNLSIFLGPALASRSFLETERVISGWESGENLRTIQIWLEPQIGLRVGFGANKNFGLRPKVNLGIPTWTVTWGTYRTNGIRPLPNGGYEQVSYSEKRSQGRVGGPARITFSLPLFYQFQFENFPVGIYLNPEIFYFPTLEKVSEIKSLFLKLGMTYRL